MTRKDFLQQLGAGAFFVLATPCLHSCTKENNGDDTPSAGDKDFEVDLADAAFTSAIASIGFAVVNEVVIAPVASGYAAASRVCAHEGTRFVTYDEAEDQWFCTTHGARFDRATGEAENDVTDRTLRIYRTELVDGGAKLRVFSR